MEAENQAFLLLGLAVVCFGLFTVVLKLGEGFADYLTLLFLSFGIASCFSAVYLKTSGDYQELKDLFAERSSFLVTLSGVLLFNGVPAVLLAVGVAGTSANLGAVVYRTWPLWMVPFIRPVLRLKVNRLQVFSLLVGVFAVEGFFTQGTLELVKFSYLPFVAALLAAAVLSGLANVLIKSEDVVMSVQLFLSNVASLAFVGGVLLVSHFFLAYSISIVALGPALLCGLVIGLTYYVGGSGFYYLALKVVSPTTAGISVMFAPFVTFLFAWVILGETVQSYSVVLAATLIVAVILQLKASAKAPEWVVPGPLGVELFDVSDAFSGDRKEPYYTYMKGNGRALATTGGLGDAFSGLDTASREKLMKEHRCLIFATKERPGWVKDRAWAYLSRSAPRERMGFSLVAMGNPDKIERALGELVRVGQPNVTC